MFAYCGNSPVVFTDPYGYEGFVGFGFQVDVSTEHGTYGVEIVIYIDPDVVAATTGDDSDQTAVALYTYSGVSVSQLELMFAPQIAEMTSSFDFESLNMMTTDELLISLSAVMSGFQLSGSVFAIYGYDNFVSADSYSGAFDTFSASISKPVSTLSGGAYYSYSNTCWAVGVKVGVSTSPKSNFLPLEFQFSHTYYSDPVILL